MSYDHHLFVRTLSQFVEKLLTPYEIDSVLDGLMLRLVETLGLVGSGVALADGDALSFTTAVPEHVDELERVQVSSGRGPCIEAFRTGRIVAVADLTARQEQWPDYCSAAARLGIVSVAGIPMQLSGVAVGAVNLYADGAREWEAADLAASKVMADMATSYLINASALRQQEQLNEQLQNALASRSLIDQAKGAVAATHNISVAEAFERIRRHARSHHVTVRAVSEAVVNLGLTV